MRRTSFNWLLFLLVVLIVAGCGSDSGSNNNPALQELQGRWTECVSGGPTFGEELVFRGDNWTSYIVDYADSNCVTPTNINQVAQGTISLGDTVTTSSGVTARKIDINQSDVTFFNIYYIDQNQLYLGDRQTGDRSSDASRPTEIDFSNYFEKRTELDDSAYDGSSSPVPIESSTGSSDAPASGNGSSNGDVNAPSTPSPIDLTILEGTWRLCDGAGSGVEIEFIGGSYSIYFTAYNELDCGTMISFQLAEQGFYTVGNSFSTSSQLVVDEIDFINEAGGTNYDLYHIDQGQLYFGDSATGDATSPEARPTDIDLTASLTKVN